MTTAADHGGKTKLHSIADGHGEVDLDVEPGYQLGGFAPRVGGRVLGHVLRRGEPGRLLGG